MVGAARSGRSADALFGRRSSVDSSATTRDGPVWNARINSGQHTPYDVAMYFDRLGGPRRGSSFVGCPRSSTRASWSVRTPPSARPARGTFSQSSQDEVPGLDLRGFELDATEARQH